MISNRLFYKLLLLLVLLLSIGIALHIYQRISDCRSRIERFVSRQEASSKFIVDWSTAIYIINDVNTSCRSCLNLEIFRKMKNPPKLIFLVNHQFSNIDIENFRAEFKLEENQTTIRITPEWSRAVRPCIKQQHQNLLIHISSDHKITHIRRF